VNDAPAVLVEGLVKRFGTFTAVDGVGFSAQRGEVLGFLGPNGAGKSTIIRILCGLLRPTAGRALVAGFDVARDPEAVRAHIGYMSQRFSLYDDLTAVENLRFFGGLYRVPAEMLAERIAWAVEMAGLAGRETELVATLAGGWKQRLALGCAVLHRPPIVFLDEPTSGVDPVSRRQFWQLIHHMAESGVTVFVSTHYMDEAEYCHRLALIDGGRLVALGTPAELKRGSIAGALLRVECQPLGEALAALARAPGVLEAAVFGDAFHVTVSSAAPALRDLPGWLAAQGLRCGSIAEIPPSLEDVFVARVGGARA